jgi:hypothetical protein
MSRPAGRPSLRQLYWSRPLRKLTILANIGILSPAAPAFDYILFPPTLPATPADLVRTIWPLLLIGLAGAVLWIGAVIARYRRMLTLVPHRCLSCGTPNPPGARFCAQCGAAFPTDAPGGTRPTP